MENIGFIGMGNMAMAIADGWIKSGVKTEKELFAYAPHQEKLKRNAQRIGFVPCATVQELVANCDTLVVACKPYQVESVLKEIRNELSQKVLLSVASGWLLERFVPLVPHDCRIQTIMPNTPCSVRSGVVLLEKDNSLYEEEQEELRRLLSALGTVLVVEGTKIPAATAISGCGPAFMDLILEAYGDAAVKYGLDRATAYALIAATMKGAAELQMESGLHPAVLKDAVCSPSGTTICGVQALEEAGLRSACMKSVDAVMKKQGY